MVRSIHKIKIASAVALTTAVPTLALVATSVPVKASDDQENVNFNVNVAEVLTVSITDPASWASGDLHQSGSAMVSDLLQNKVTVSAMTNNATGVTVSMYTPNTNLVNQSTSSQTIPTLTSATTAANFPVNRWGYSLDGGANYNAITKSASQVFTTVGTSSTSSGSEDIYFGAKADNTKKSGTYAQTVYFAAVTGTIDSGNPKIPTDPSTPDPINNNPSYDSNTGNPATGQTTYTRRTTSGSGSSPVSGAKKTTTTEVSKGDTRSSYQPAQGVTTTTSSSSIDGSSSLATALGVAAGVAAVSGAAFFVAAKRRKDDE
ncbi:hypothetical protein IKG24_01360 [Candidatus Saccharibacteria bacterium]|nr:hypothetical protein [Candidatus Saccharibacteria bacterium]